MKVTQQDLVTVELAVSKKSCFVKDPKVLPLMEQIQQWPQSKGWERSVRGALMRSLMERRLEHLPSTDAWDLHLSEHNNYINN